MEIKQQCDKQDLKLAILELKVSIQELDIIKNDSVQCAQELDDIETSLKNALRLLEDFKSKLNE